MKYSEEISRSALSFEKPMPAACQHYRKECNGCHLMHIPYEQQLEEKKKAVSKLFGVQVEIEPSPQNFHYRNKIELSYINGLLGYRHRGNFFESFKLEKCLLVSERMNESIQEVAKLLKEFNMESAAIMKRKKGLGYVTFRENRKGESMVNFTYFGEVNENSPKIAKTLLNYGVRSVNVVLNETWSDTSFGKVIDRAGEEFIIEEVLGNKFLIGANTFFQANTLGAERIFSRVKEFIENNSKTLDLYCGVGVISISIACKCREVIGVEQNRESVMNALHNSLLNNCSNTRFVCADTGEILNQIEEADVAILDPPRSGIEKKALKRLLEISPKRIIYLSCNPQTLACDIRELEGYRIIFIRGFDQFAHTKHLEMLCVLERSGR